MGIACGSTAPEAAPLAIAQTPTAVRATEFRPPSVPLVTSDPYLSIWSNASSLTDDVTRHWTGSPQPLNSLIRVDGKTFRLMGQEPVGVAALPQVGVQVLPTRTIYDFENAQIHVSLSFMTPMLPGDLNVLARPVTYLTWDVRSVDGASHAVSILSSASSLLAVNTPEEKVECARETMGALTALRVGTQNQPYLSNPGDGTRINWGHALLIAPSASSKSAIGAGDALLSGFAARGTLPLQDEPNQARAANEHSATLVFVFDVGQVGAAPVARHAMVAYDEVYAVNYFGQKLRPYWRRGNTTPAAMLQSAERDYEGLTRRCAAFDSELMADAARSGGEKYARIIGLAYRQAIAGTGIAADKNDQPLVFTKENSSNGDIATVDVLFPMSPIFLLTNPTLAKAMVVPILDYSASKRWTFPNAPHDLGTYPVVMGRDDGGEAMPVEESGDMLILCDAIAQNDGNTRFLDKWWPQLSQWAHFLEQYGLDPEDQLCTDDFMGHLAHNANLSVKAIVALAAYSDLARLHGDLATAKHYRALADADAKHWMQVADGGEASLLAFDKPGTWSQKYNLVWDKVLHLNVFPPQVAQKEMAHYLKMMKPLGVPLDSRTNIGDLDHSFFAATLASKDADFRAMIEPFYDYLNATSARLPLVDTYRVDDIHSDGMRARPVVGGAFIKMIADRSLWKKWASRDQQRFGPNASLPLPPIITSVVPTGQKNAPMWRYSTEQPATGWEAMTFDDSKWQSGVGGFGNAPGLSAHTPWTTSDIWMRREFVMPKGSFSNLQFSIYHDEDIEIYLNGVLASSATWYEPTYTQLEISPQARALLKPGAKITLAVHVHQTAGGQGADVGIVNVVPAKE